MACSGPCSTHREPRCRRSSHRSTWPPRWPMRCMTAVRSWPSSRRSWRTGCHAPATSRSVRPWRRCCVTLVSSLPRSPSSAAGSTSAWRMISWNGSPPPPTSRRPASGTCRWWSRPAGTLRRPWPRRRSCRTSQASWWSRPAGSAGSTATRPTASTSPPTCRYWDGHRSWWCPPASSRSWTSRRRSSGWRRSG